MGCAERLCIDCGNTLDVDPLCFKRGADSRPPLPMPVKIYDVCTQSPAVRFRLFRRARRGAPEKLRSASASERAEKAALILEIARQPDNPRTLHAFAR